jgi:uncharacterized repeat protein (TIGR01451 family)
MNKKSIYLAGLAIATVSLIPFNGAQPLLAKAFQASATVAANLLNQPKVNLQLSAEKQIRSVDKVTGQEKITWQAMAQGNNAVKSGEVVRYKVLSENKGDRPAENLAITQPVPAGMTYVLGSATMGNTPGTTLTYSIDKGKSFVAAPMVPVTLANGKTEMRPAPATAYSHVRFSFAQALAAKTATVSSYEVKVK